LNDLHATIILIGPMSAGKSTIGKLLAEELNLPQYAIDKNRWPYYEEIGYDRELAAQIASEQGMVALLHHWKPYEAHTVERVLTEHSKCVIDFGAGHSVYEDAKLFARVQAALAPYPNVILILPSPDLDESVQILNERFAQLLEHEGIEMDPELLKVNEHFVKHSSNHTLAKMTIYTNGKTPVETCDEILQQLVK
jgi:shikimate kinase